jgi:hypothetical protein
VPSVRKEDWASPPARHFKGFTLKLCFCTVEQTTVLRTVSLGGHTARKVLSPILHSFCALENSDALQAHCAHYAAELQVAEAWEAACRRHSRSEIFLGLYKQQPTNFTTSRGSILTFNRRWVLFSRCRVMKSNTVTRITNSMALLRVYPCTNGHNSHKRQDPPYHVAIDGRCVKPRPESSSTSAVCMVLEAKSGGRDTHRTPS